MYYYFSNIVTCVCFILLKWIASSNNIGVIQLHYDPISYHLLLLTEILKLFMKYIHESIKIFLADLVTEWFDIRKIYPLKFSPHTLVLPKCLRENKCLKRFSTEVSLDLIIEIS